MTKDHIQKLYSRLVIADGGCLEYIGHLSHDGYGKFCFYIGGKPTTKRVHRVMFEYYVGPIASGLSLDHLCRNKRCANPNHLDPVTNLENRRRRNQLVTQCKYGHEFSPENTRLEANGDRVCRACVSRYSQAAYAQKKSRASDTGTA